MLKLNKSMHKNNIYIRFGLAKFHCGKVSSALWFINTLVLLMVTMFLVIKYDIFLAS